MYIQGGAFDHQQGIEGGEILDSIQKSLSSTLMSVERPPLHLKLWNCLDDDEVWECVEGLSLSDRVKVFTCPGTEAVSHLIKKVAMESSTSYTGSPTHLISNTSTPTSNGQTKRDCLTTIVCFEEDLLRFCKYVTPPASNERSRNRLRSSGGSVDSSAYLSYRIGRHRRQSERKCLEKQDDKDDCEESATYILSNVLLCGGGITFSSAALEHPERLRRAFDSVLSSELWLIPVRARPSHMLCEGDDNGSGIFPLDTVILFSPGSEVCVLSLAGLVCRYFTSTLRERIDTYSSIPLPIWTRAMTFNTQVPPSPKDNHTGSKTPWIFGSVEMAALWIALSEADRLQLLRNIGAAAEELGSKGCDAYTMSILSLVAQVSPGGKFNLEEAVASRSFLAIESPVGRLLLEAMGMTTLEAVCCCGPVALTFSDRAWEVCQAYCSEYNASILITQEANTPVPTPPHKAKTKKKKTKKRKSGTSSSSVSGNRVAVSGYSTALSVMEHANSFDDIESENGEGHEIDTASNSYAGDASTVTSIGSPYIQDGSAHGASNKIAAGNAQNQLNSIGSDSIHNSAESFPIDGWSQVTRRRDSQEEKDHVSDICNIDEERENNIIDTNDISRSVSHGSENVDIVCEHNGGMNGAVVKHEGVNGMQNHSLVDLHEVTQNFANSLHIESPKSQADPSSDQNTLQSPPVPANEHNIEEIEPIDIQQQPINTSVRGSMRYSPDPKTDLKSDLLSPEAAARLSMEIEEMAAKLRAVAERRAPWMLGALSRLRGLVIRLWPLAVVEVYGSCSTGLAIPASDMDVVIAHIPDNMQWWNNTVGGSPIAALANELRRETWVSSVKSLEHATIPIIKLECACVPAGYADHSRSIIKIDISFNGGGGIPHRGISTTAFAQRQRATHPQLMPLVLVLKQLLVERGLHEAYTGGLSSYALTIMLSALLQRHALLPPPLRPSLGSLFATFLAIFGSSLDTRKWGVVVGSGDFGPIAPLQALQCIPKVGTPDFWTYAADPVVIQDPLQPDINVGRTCFGFRQVQLALDESLSALLNFEDGEGKSMLGAVFGTQHHIAVVNLTAKMWCPEEQQNNTSKVQQHTSHVHAHIQQPIPTNAVSISTQQYSSPRVQPSIHTPVPVPNIPHGQEGMLSTHPQAIVHQNQMQMPASTLPPPSRYVMAPPAPVNLQPAVNLQPGVNIRQPTVQNSNNVLKHNMTKGSNRVLTPPPRRNSELNSPRQGHGMGGFTQAPMHTPPPYNNTHVHARNAHIPKLSLSPPPGAHRRLDKHSLSPPPPQVRPFQPIGAGGGWIPSQNVPQPSQGMMPNVDEMRSMCMHMIRNLDGNCLMDATSYLQLLVNRQTRDS